MKKITFLFIMMLICSNVMFGQYYYNSYVNAGINPGGLNSDAEYPDQGGLPAGWTQVLGASNATPTWSTSQTLPFNFNFNGSPVNSYKVSSSGVLTFASVVGAVPSYTNSALPNVAIPDSSICVWGLAGTGSNDKVMMKVFGTAPNRQLWLFFSSYSEGGATASFWTYWSIVLEETSNKIYIVDQRTANGTSSLTVGVQVNSTTAYQLPTSPNVVNNAGTSPNADDNTYYEFIQGTRPMYDVRMTSFDINPNLSLTQAPFAIKGSYINYGSETVTSATINYSINGNPPVAGALSGLNVAVMGSSNFTHPTNWQPSVSGNYTIKIWIDNINGNQDLNHLNDTITKVIQVHQNIVQRLPLLESFTSSTCGPCVAGNQALSTATAANPNKWVLIKYQMSWPGNGDPYYTAEGGVRRTLYNISSVPELHVDGGAGMNTSGFTSAMLNTAYAIPAFMNLNATFSLVGKKIISDITIDPIANFNTTNLKLFAAIVETVTHNNVGTNGETEFKWVMKKMMPDANGTALSALTSGTSVTKHLEWEFVGNYRLPANASSPINHATEHSVENFDNLTLVVWVQDMTTKEVHQAAYGTKIAGVNDVIDNGEIIALYPNPAIDNTTIQYQVKGNRNVSVEVYNMVGKLVYVENIGQQEDGIYSKSIPTDKLSSGMYIIKMKIGDAYVSHRLSIQ